MAGAAEKNFAPLRRYHVEESLSTSVVRPHAPHLSIRRRSIDRLPRASTRSTDDQTGHPVTYRGIGF